MRPAVAPALLSAALSLLGLGQVVGAGRGWWQAAAVLSGTLAVLLLRRAPVAVCALAAASVAAQVGLGAADPAFASFLVLLLSAYGLGRRCSPRGLAAGLLLLALAIAAVVTADPTLRRPAELVYPAVYLSAAVGLGRLVRSRERAAAAAVAAVAAASESREREALAEERARIAREMHDVVAHSVSLLVVQAESAAAVLDRDPERARAQLERISDSGRQALDELRRVLGLLQPGDEDPGAAPQPGLVDLPALAESLRAAGARVALHVDEGLSDLAPGLQLAAYRVVQEALTNAVRHGHAGAVDVQVRCRNGVLTVDVQDDGTTPAASAPGQGLRGMRERLRLYDGHLDAGPSEGGGFRVAARIRVAP